MGFKRFGLLSLIGGLAFGTAACTDGFGYGGASLGYGSAYYADPYFAGGGWGGGLAPGFGGPFGWYNDFYYPGTGVFVYDRYRRPFRWNDAQRRYWQGRPGWNAPGARANWNAFRRDYRAGAPGFRGDIRRDPRQFRNDARPDWRARRPDNRGDGIRTPGFNRGPGINRGPGMNRGSGRGPGPRGSGRPR